MYSNSLTYRMFVAATILAGAVVLGLAVTSCVTMAPPKPCADEMTAQFPVPKDQWYLVSEDNTPEYLIVSFLRKDKTRYKLVGVTRKDSENARKMVAFGFTEGATCVGPKGDVGIILTMSGSPSIESPQNAGPGI